MTINQRGKTRAEIELEARQREREAVKLRADGLAYDEIADELGYANESGARQAVDRGLRRAADPDVERLRQVEVRRLESYRMGLLRELERDHVVVSHGRVVRDQGGEPVRDTVAVVTIYRELRMLSVEYSRLLGLHAPSRMVVEEVTQDMVKAEIARINALAERLERETGEGDVRQDVPRLTA